MSAAKRHHYVPQTYLRKFCEPSGSETIYFLDRTKSSVGDIKPTSVKNICIEGHLYRLNKDGEDSQIIEKFYSDDIEGSYNEIYEVLTNDKIDKLTSEQREKIIEYVITQLYRSPKWKNFHINILNRVLENMYYMCEHIGSETFDYEGITISIKDKSLEDSQKEWYYHSKEAFLRTHLDVAYKLISYRLASDSIMVSKLEDDKEFITSDNPVIYYNPDVQHQIAFHPSNVLQLPLSPKYMVMLMPGSKPQYQHLITRKTCTGEISQIERLVANYDQLNSSERFILGTKTGLEKYLETKELSERPMTDEEDKNLDSFDATLELFKMRGLI